MDEFVYVIYTFVDLLWRTSSSTVSRSRRRLQSSRENSQIFFSFLRIIFAFLDPDLHTTILCYRTLPYFLQVLSSPGNYPGFEVRLLSGSLEHRLHNLWALYRYHQSSVADPESGAFLILGSGMGKKLGSGSGLRIQAEQPDHISECSETIFFWLKYLNSLMQIRDPGWKKFGSGSQIHNTASKKNFALEKILLCFVYPNN